MHPHGQLIFDGEHNGTHRSNRADYEDGEEGRAVTLLTPFERKAAGAARFVEVEEIPAGVIAAAVPDTRVALDWTAAGINRGPGLPAVVSMGHKTVPRALEAGGLVVASLRCS